MDPRTLSRWRVTAVVAGAGLCVALFGYNVAAQDFLSDDSFISFRYARNLVSGHGLTWNPGERVEGYTNFAWVLLMAGALRAGIPVEVASRVLGVASGLGVLAAVVLLAARWRPPWHPVVWIAPLTLATHRSFAAWSTSGLETMFFTALVVGAVLAYSGESRRRSERPWLSAALLVAAGLTRPEGALFIAGLGACYLAEVAARRRTAGGLVFWATCCALPLAAHVLWRHHYYGDWLPNTFHAKVDGWSWEKGAFHLMLFHRTYRIGWFLPLAVLGVVARRRRDLVVVSFVLTALYVTYVAAVGGDRFEFRFLVVVLPFLYLLVGEGIGWIAEWRAELPAARRLGPALASVLALALVSTTVWGGRHALVATKDRRDIEPLRLTRAYARDRIEDGTYLRRLIDEGALPDDLTICVGGAGALPYYTEWPTVDRRGLNDAWIARQPARPRGAVGHLREAPYEYLVARGVVVFDVFNDLVQSDPWKHLGKSRSFQGNPLRIRAVELEEDRYLVFASLVTDDELARVFPGRLILR